MFWNTCFTVEWVIGLQRYSVSYYLLEHEVYTSLLRKGSLFPKSILTENEQTDLKI